MDYSKEASEQRNSKHICSAPEAWTGRPAGPNEISVNSVDCLKTVYYGGSEKHRWYSDAFVSFDMRNMVTSLDHKSHSVQKRSIPDLRVITNDLL